MESIHTFENKTAAVEEAQAFFVGGGNTFMLLKNLYNLNLIDPIKKRVLNVRTIEKIQFSIHIVGYF